MLDGKVDKIDYEAGTYLVLYSDGQEERYAAALNDPEMYMLVGNYASQGNVIDMDITDNGTAAQQDCKPRSDVP